MVSEFPSSDKFHVSVVLMVICSPSRSNIITELIVRECPSSDHVAVDFLSLSPKTTLVHSLPSSVSFSVDLNSSPEGLTDSLSICSSFSFCETVSCVAAPLKRPSPSSLLL
jgi:hypothetical protein